MIKILIAIQARSTSTRLPEKSLAIIDTHTMTDHVVAACLSACDHVNKQKTAIPLHAQAALLVPTGDKLKELFDDKLAVYEGPEDDVLSRFMLAIDKLQPDYVVRVTADCALHTAPIISKHILCAVFDKLDYCSNVHEECRTYIDGLDVEVISLQLMKWLDEHAVSLSDREHVTVKARKDGPSWMKMGNVIGYIDLSDIKLSVDTKEDVERVRANKKSVNAKLNRAKQLGKLFRF